MGKRMVALLFIIMAGVIGIGLAGCATGPAPTGPAKTMPELLKQAGFKALSADTPQEMAHLQSCPKDTLMIHEREGARFYAFADSASKSMYIGDEAAYRRFKALLEEREEKILVQRLRDTQFWMMWGVRYGGR